MTNLNLMSRPDFLIHAERTDIECSNCEEDNLYDLDFELVCGNCFYVNDPNDGEKRLGPWERFWQERAEYEGHYGEERKRVVGGFHGEYVYGEGDSISERLYG